MRDDVEEANIISQEIRLPKGAYPKDLLTKLHNLTGTDFGARLISKSKYTIRGSFIGAGLGAGLAMYFKKSIMGGIVLFGMGGALIGYKIGDYFEQRQLKLQEQNEQSQTEK
jgi:hypothetical protein